MIIPARILDGANLNVYSPRQSQNEPAENKSNNINSIDTQINNQVISSNENEEEWETINEEMTEKKKKKIEMLDFF
ncbi:unnamed protein product [Brachionus calyciflorus]|uniref:Uncharacterized protein n=1 Tax=Brachionus calyciflorus TaxID=104777 RepID=A0A814L1C7_9BILA|nr:unnamed protein product [Brachionus calyciflorus]